MVYVAFVTDAYGKRIVDGGAANGACRLHHGCLKQGAQVNQPQRSAAWFSLYVSEMIPDLSSGNQAADQSGTIAKAPVSATVLSAPARRRLFWNLGLLILLSNLGSPSGGLFEIALSLLLKNKLHLSASEVSTLRALGAIPIYMSAVFGFVRDSWNPFGMEDRGFIILFGSLTVALYALLALVPVTYLSLLAALLLLRVSFRLVSSAENGLVSALGQQHTISGQVSALWNIVISAMGAASLLLGGELSNLVEAESGDDAFHVLFVVCAFLIAGVVLYAWWRPKILFDSVRGERHAQIHPIDDLRRLAKHWPIYPATAIMMLWNFAPGTDTPLLYYLQTRFHATDADWGEWNAIFQASSIPAIVAFGFLSARFPLGKLLVCGTLIGIPQMVPLLLVRSMNDALVAAAVMGLMGGMATAAYLALIIRSCPRGLQGTVLMMSGSLVVATVRLGDMLGASVYDNLGGFQSCVIATTIAYTLILPTISLLPRALISTADSETRKP